ncbi:MAG: glycosyltransferase [Blastocatellia bacterium]|nr:glycosyltransferase [Blastocatellia bacterium]
MIGYVHFRGQMGDLVRVEAIRRFFDEHDMAYKEFALTHERGDVDIVREILSPLGAKHLARKMAIDRAHPFLKEINWRIEARQWERSTDQGVRLLKDDLHGVNMLQAETLFAGIVCLRLKESRGVPFVYDMHGVMREESKLSGSDEWMAWCARWEKRVMEAADHVIAVSPIMADYVAKTYAVPRERILMVPNGSYLTERQARFEKPLTVIYAGNFAPYESIMEFVRTAEMAANSDYRFWLLGDGSLRNEVFDYVNANFVDLLYWGRKRRDVALDFCACAQIGFAGQSGCLEPERDFPRQIGCPIKLFDYASCGLPFIVPPGEWSSLIEEADCGVVARSCDASAFVEAIHQLSDQTIWERKSRNCKELIRSRFQWAQVLAPLAEILQ